MKILQVTQLFKPNWEAGGVARSSYEISKQLQNLGHDVTVYTTNKGSVIKSKINRPTYVDGIKVYYFDDLRKYIPLRIRITIPYFLPFVAKDEIKDFDVIHIHEHRTFLAAIVSHYARKNNIPILLQPRGSIQRIHKTIFKKLYDELIGYKIIKNAKAIILSSKREFQLSKNIFDEINLNNSVINYLPNGLDFSLYQKLPTKIKFREKYKVKNSERIILYLGRIHEVKGLDLLVEAFYRLLLENENLKLIIVGPDRGYKSKLKSMISHYGIKDNVIIIDGLFDEDKLSAYVAADVFVLPSKEIESFGNVALESIACGIPTVVTNVCGISEWVENVIKVNPDIESLRGGIANALSDDGKELGKKAKIEAEKYDWATITKSIVKLYFNAFEK